jgi:hypothetical protein
VSSLHEAAAYVAGFGETPLNAALSRSDPRDMSGRGFTVQARFAGDGSIYLRKQ